MSNSEAKGPTPSGEAEPTRTKEEAQQELVEKFGIRDTTAFRAALQAGDITRAKAWLSYIEENKDRFPQYRATWKDWLADRKQEISQQELFELFGMRKTSDFREALDRGDIDNARTWLEYITKHRDKFPQYNDAWFKDRQKELEQASS